MKIDISGFLPIRSNSEEKKDLDSSLTDGDDVKFSTEEMLPPETTLETVVEETDLEEVEIEVNWEDETETLCSSSISSRSSSSSSSSEESIQNAGTTHTTITITACSSSSSDSSSPSNSSNDSDCDSESDSDATLTNEIEVEAAEWDVKIDWNGNGHALGESRISTDGNPALVDSKESSIQLTTTPYNFPQKEEHDGIESAEFETKPAAASAYQLLQESCQITSSSGSQQTLINKANGVIHGHGQHFCFQEAHEPNSKENKKEHVNDENKVKGKDFDDLLVNDEVVERRFEKSRCNCEHSNNKNKSCGCESEKKKQRCDSYVENERAQQGWNDTANHDLSSCVIGTEEVKTGFEIHSRIINDLRSVNDFNKKHDVLLHFVQNCDDKLGPQYTLLEYFAQKSQRSPLPVVSPFNDNNSKEDFHKYTDGVRISPPKEFANPIATKSSRKAENMHQRLSGEPRLRSVLKKPGQGKKIKGRSVTFNESLNLFYEAECSCWIHEDDYARLRAEEQHQQQQFFFEQHTHLQQQQQHIHHHQHQQIQQQHHHPHVTPQPQSFIFEPPPIEFDDPPTLSPPEGYKDRFFPQEMDPDVTRVTPPSPPAARRKVFLKENPTVVMNGLPPQMDNEEEVEETKKKGSRLGGILKGGRLWRSNSTDGKKVVSPPEEPDVVKCTEKDREGDKDAEPTVSKQNMKTQTVLSVELNDPRKDGSGDGKSVGNYIGPSKVSTGTAPLRTSEQIRLAVDSTLRLRTVKKNKAECSSLVEKLRWLTSLDDDEQSDSSQSGFATWPSRDKNGIAISKKSDAGTSTNEEFVHSAVRQPPSIHSANEARINKISYTLEDIDEGLKGNENELETFINEDSGRIERLKKRYNEEGGDDYGFSRRPSVKGIKPRFSSSTQIFAQFTAIGPAGHETPIPIEAQYENTSGSGELPTHSQSGMEGTTTAIYDPSQLYEFQNSSGMQTPTPRPMEEASQSKSHFEMLRQTFEQGSLPGLSSNRPHSWSVSTLPHNSSSNSSNQHPHHNHSHSISLGSAGAGATTLGGFPPPIITSNLSGSNLSVASQPQLMTPQRFITSGTVISGTGNNLGSQSNSNNNNSNARGSSGGTGVVMNTHPHYGTLSGINVYGNEQGSGSQMNFTVGPMTQPPNLYGTVRRVPNVIGRPLFLHYGALSVEAHPNKLSDGSFPRPKVPETPSPTQQPPPIRYYGPPIRYYNPPPPVPPRSITTTLGSGSSGSGSSTSNTSECPQERGVPEGATDEEPSMKEPYSAMKV